jgi:hypothetical protein
LKQLTHEISNLAERRRRVKNIIATEANLSTQSGGQDDEVYINRQKSLNQYLMLLQRRFLKKTAGLNVAKKLRQVLLETDGSFIEHHKLVKIMRRYDTEESYLKMKGVDRAGVDKAQQQEFVRDEL